MSQMSDEIRLMQMLAVQSKEKIIEIIFELNETIREKEIKLIEQKSMVEFADIIIKSKDSILIDDMLKLLNSEKIYVEEDRLFDILRSKKILMSNNQPYQKYIDNNWFSTTEVTKDTIYGSKMFIDTLVKPRGQLGVVELVKSELKGDKNES